MGEQGDNNMVEIMARDTIEGHKVCQTYDTKWLCLSNIYNHLQRPNFYDIGGTYLNEVANFWFLYKTEQVSKLYILHLFVYNRHEGLFSFSLCNSNEMTINERTSTIHLNSVSKVYMFEKLLESTYSYITTYSFSELDVELMRDKTLFIALEINKTSIKEWQNPMDHVKSLHDFGQLISDPVGADFAIVAMDGTRLPVHKFLLAARSEVFKAMLKDDTAESLNSSVKIDDVSKENLSALIEFIYTGTIKDIENKNWFYLLMLGERYDIKGLKELAQHALAQSLNTENALETLMAADLYNSPVLKTRALKYIKTNIASLDSSLFHEINNIQLVQELCKFLAMKY